MQRYQKIVVIAALDGRDSTTLDHASCFARAAGARHVYLTHVVQPPEAIEASRKVGLIQSAREASLDKLKSLAASQKHRFDEATKVECVVKDGAFSMEISKFALHGQADLIALTRLPTKSPDPLMDYSGRLLRAAPCSVLIAVAGTAPEYKRVLVAIDFSEASRDALDVAFAAASTAKDSSVTILHVYYPQLEGAERKREKAEAAARKYAEGQWEKMRADVNTRGVPWTIRFECSSDVPDVIIDVSEKSKANLIVVSSHGRTQNPALLLGHVPEMVCGRTERSFLCVKRRGHVVGLIEALMRFLSIHPKT